MFRLALSSQNYFLLFETPILTFCLLTPETRAVATPVSGRKWVQSTKLDTVNGSLNNLCALALGLALHIFTRQCRGVPRKTKPLSTVAILPYRLLSCLVSRNVFCEVLASHFIVVLHVASALEMEKSQISVLVVNMVGASVVKRATHPHKLFLVILPPGINTLAAASRAKEILIHNKGYRIVPFNFTVLANLTCARCSLRNI